MIWPFSIFQKPSMQDDTAHDFIAQLATHLAAQQFGDGDLPDTLQFSGSQRDRFIRFPPLFRAVSIISSLCAQMMCNGGMTVRNADDAKVVNRRTSASWNCSATRLTAALHRRKISSKT